jgi:hypothetical protein
VTHLRSILLALLGALLLVSQHTAVTHALWHQAHGSEQHAPVGVAATDPNEHGHDADSSPLCAFDAMLGQVLYGGVTASALDVHSAQGSDSIVCATPQLLASTPVQPRSRGPPGIL